MKLNYIIILFALLAVSGCSIFPKKEKETEEEQVPKYGPVQTNTPETTESYWASGEKPQKLKLFLNKGNSFIYFHDLHSGKQAGFSQVSLFNFPTDGYYHGKPVNGDMVEFASTAGTISFSTTNSSADVYIPDVGFAILKSYVETNTPLVVISDKPLPPVAFPVTFTGTPTEEANPVESSNPFTRSREATERKGNEPIAEGLVAELIPQLEAMQKGPTRLGIE